MVNFFSQSHTYDDNWATVALAFFLRYPNPFAAHVLSCDVIDRSFTSEGSLRTTRLILKRGNLPKWFPSGVVARSESWIIEESEVDSFGRRMTCTTRNLEHTKALRVIEQVTLRPLDDGRTLQTTEARFKSRFGWGLTKRIESYASSKFRSNIEKVFVSPGYLSRAQSSPRVTYAAPAPRRTHRINWDNLRHIRISSSRST
ncbi:unnamed protein product [Rhizoctonia solani]|uniref:PRELI/MSF1 domain-containing protein n=1 Tax=Rhizoctonia solani TaxID=456999 RepID=A0A8H3E8P0_9AGAM|nr:unnamed protein product [Rhizoctonia solani]